VVVVDWKGEYAVRIAGATIIRKIQNIWDVPGSTPRERALIAVELIREMARDVVEVTPPSSCSSSRSLWRSIGGGSDDREDNQDPGEACRGGWREEVR